jgi:hypothetical protein
MRMALCCVPAALAGCAVLIAIYVPLFGILALGASAADALFIVAPFVTLYVLGYGLIALCAGMLLIFLAGCNVLEHPKRFAALATGVILIMGLPTGAFLGLLLLGLPGMFVSFVVLARALERFASVVQDC